MLTEIARSVALIVDPAMILIVLIATVSYVIVSFFIDPTACFQIFMRLLGVIQLFDSDTKTVQRVQQYSWLVINHIDTRLRQQLARSDHNEEELVVAALMKLSQERDAATRELIRAVAQSAPTSTVAGTAEKALEKYVGSY